MPWRNLSCLLLCTSLMAVAESGADATLRRLSESVASAGSCYTVEARKWTIWDDQQSGLPSRVYISSWRSGDRFRTEEGPDRANVMSRFVTDGSLVWEHAASWRQYKQDSAGSKLGSDVMEHVRDIDRMLLGRFLLLPKFRVLATEEGTAIVKTRDGEHRCNIVRIIPEDVQERSWEERLWIDVASGLMRKSVVRRRVIVPEAGLKRERGETEMIVWEHIALGSPIDDAVFHFAPPPGTRLVKSFEPTAGPQSLSPPSL